MIDPALSDEQVAVARALEGVITWLRDQRQPQILSASALSVLSRLETLGPLRVTDLAEREGLSQPGTTTLVNRLTASGLAVRAADDSDRRAVLVSITDEGSRSLAAYRASRANLIATRIRSLSLDEQRLLHQALPALEHFVAADEHPTPEKGSTL